MPRFFSKEKDLITTMKSESIKKISSSSDFKLLRSAIEEMYQDDTTIRRNVNQTNNSSSTLGTLTLDTLESNYYNLSNLQNIRNYSNEAYTFYPIYSTILDALSNMYLWRYVYYPRQTKDVSQNATDFEEIYVQMAEAVDGLNIENTFPMLLTNLLIHGALFVTTIRRTSSKTLTTIVLPPQYCRMTSITQYGTSVFQFDFSYFDGLGLTKEQLDLIFDFYPKEMRAMYELYLGDNNLYRWQKMNPKYSAGFALNSNGFPTYLRSLHAIKQYDSYRTNELERNGQQLQKIIAHKLPTWEDKLVVEVPEMKALHKSMSKVLTKNKNTRMLTTFGDLDVLSLGEDQSKENKTLENAFSAIFNAVGENDNLYIGNTKEGLEFSLRRQESIIWKHIQGLVAFYSLALNNQFNFKGYQCSLNMLPLTVYNFKDSMLQYKEGATLGVSKLEYMVGLGTKQIDINAKNTLEDYLKLDMLKPLNSSHTQSKVAANVVAGNKGDNTSTQSNEEEELNNKKQNKKEVQNEQE